MIVSGTHLLGLYLAWVIVLCCFIFIPRVFHPESSVTNPADQQTNPFTQLHGIKLPLKLQLALYACDNILVLIYQCMVHYIPFIGVRGLGYFANQLQSGISLESLSKKRVDLKNCTALVGNFYSSGYQHIVRFVPHSISFVHSWILKNCLELVMETVLLKPANYNL